jgi:GNAT superfamily N-acetyltransferase
MHTITDREQSVVLSLLSDVRCRYRKHRLRGALALAGRRLAKTLKPKDEDLVIVKVLDNAIDPAVGQQLQIEDLAPHHLAGLVDFNRRRCDSRANRRFVHDLKKGYRGFVASSDNEIVGYYWWVDKQIDPHHAHLARLGISLDDHDVYGFDFFMADEHRGGGNAVAFLDHVEGSLKQLGYRRLWGYVERGNTPARWLYGTRGYEVVRSVPAQ